MKKLEDVMDEINQLISEFDFPPSVLMDVDRRLADCRDPAYADQQLRYLKHVSKSHLAKRKPS